MHHLTGCAPEKKEEGSVPSAQGASGDVNNRVLHSRAVEAVIWGMPAVNYDLMLQQMLTKTSGKVGQVIYWGRPLDSKNQTLTPNPDALYFMVFFNLKDGAAVLDLPLGDENGSFNGNIVTLWQMLSKTQVCLGMITAKAGSICSFLRAIKTSRPRATFRFNQTPSAATCCFDRI